MANVQRASLCARERHLGADIRRGVLYTSDAGASLRRSSRRSSPASCPTACARIPVRRATTALRVDALAGGDRARPRRRPHAVLVVSSAGTTNTGAVDPLDVDRRPVRRRGPVAPRRRRVRRVLPRSCRELRPLLRGLSRADSLTLDPHKGMFLPYGTGALLVRDGAALRAAHDATAGYLPAHAAPRRVLRSEPVRPGPVARISRPACVAVRQDVRRGGLPRRDCREARARARRALARIAALPGIVIDAPPAAVAVRVPPHVARARRWPRRTPPPGR